MRKAAAKRKRKKEDKKAAKAAAKAAAKVEEDGTSVDAEPSGEGEAEDEATVALRAELEPLRLSALQKRAAAEGVDEEKLDDALDGNNVKAAVIGLILAAVAASNAAAEAAAKEAEEAAAAVPADGHLITDEQGTPATEPDDEAFDLDSLPCVHSAERHRLGLC
eukprot:COSAG05_NODE_4929_length_1323_cov_2.189542_1_plen_164_part_00